MTLIDAAATNLAGKGAALGAEVVTQLAAKSPQLGAVVEKLGFKEIFTASSMTAAFLPVAQGITSHLWKGLCKVVTYPVTKFKQHREHKAKIKQESPYEIQVRELRAQVASLSEQVGKGHPVPATATKTKVAAPAKFAGSNTPAPYAKPGGIRI